VARLLTCGFEIPNYMTPFDYYIENSGGFSWDSAKRSGAYGLKADGGSSGTPPQRYALIPGNPAEIYFQIAFSISGTNQYNNCDLLQVRSDVTDQLLRVRAYNGGPVTILVNGTTRITSTKMVSTGWNLLEVHFKMDDAGIVELKLEGVYQGSWEGDTKPGADTGLTQFQIGAYSLSRITTYDDFCLNDVSGAADNSWLGGSRIIALRPNAAGDLAQWTPNTGENYAAVDEVTPDGDTTYVATDTADKIDLYNLAAPSLPTGAVINRVWVQAVAKKMDAGVDDKVSLGVKSGATTDWSTAKTLSTAYELISGTDYTVNPDDSEAWEEADLNALQAGIKAA